MLKTFSRRIRPTASDRKRRAERLAQKAQQEAQSAQQEVQSSEVSQQEEVPQQEDVHEEVPQQEDVHEEVPPAEYLPSGMNINEGEGESGMIEGEGEEAEGINEDDEILREPFPGGPHDPSLLWGFKTHIASKIWFGEERGVLKCLCHTTKLLQWHFNSGLHKWRSFFRDSHLDQVSQISYQRPNRNLILAFMERWHPETNTFHMPFGEMTITLDDVYCLVGLPVTGIPLQPRSDDKPEIRISRLFGVTLDEVNKSLEGARGSTMKLEWLRKNFSHKIMDNSDDGSLIYSAMAYLLYVMGCTLLSDKTCTRVSTGLLDFVEDITMIHRYAWGTATLAHLYRQLGLASRIGVKQMSGYLTLLEVWIYEHFPTTRPPPNLQYNVGEPLAMRWSQQAHGGASLGGVQVYREWLDSLTPADVIWDPYVDVRHIFPCPEVSFYYGCIRSLEILEPYHPDRVLRQFGHVQTIPLDPLVPARARRGNTHGHYNALWGVLGGYFVAWDSHILSDARRGRLTDPAWECSPEYMQWYKKYSHPIVQNPQHRSTYAHKMVSADAIQPWERVMKARNLLEPIVQRWNADDESLSLDQVMPTVQEAYVALQGLH